MLRDFKGLDVSHEQAEGRIWSMSGIYHLIAPLGGTLGFNSEVLKVRFYRLCHVLMVFLFYMFFQDTDYGECSLIIFISILNFLLIFTKDLDR